MEAYSPLRSPQGLINWSLISQLSELQEKEGLHAANKVTRKHIQFKSQIMKVSLAAQVLSRSVALALLFVKKAGYAEFIECDATVKFIQVKS